MWFQGSTPSGLAELNACALWVAAFEMDERRCQDHQPSVEVALRPAPDHDHLFVVSGRHVFPGVEFQRSRVGVLEISPTRSSDGVRP